MKHKATCDQPGCNVEINREIIHACGGMHGKNDFSCEKYFCGSHQFMAKIIHGKFAGLCKGLCEICVKKQKHYKRTIN